VAEILLAGMTHYPLLSTTDERMADLLRMTLADPGLPEEVADPAAWPEAMRAEWGDDGGKAAAALHRAELLGGLKVIRDAIETFDPDAIFLWGDDQYENFREGIIPPYALLAYGDLEAQPWASFPWPNVWDEPSDATFTLRGRPDIARWLATRLLEDEFDLAYAYQPLHHPSLPHAFLNTQLFLDYDRRGFRWPLVCMPINCYGRRVIAARGFCKPFGTELDLDPPSPTPRRLMDLGGAVARHLRESPWRVVVMASSSWSHAFLCDKLWRLRPDTPADRILFDALLAADFDRWAATTTEEIEGAGQQELLNWFALAGAARSLAIGAPTWGTFVETYCFNSNKVFATWPTSP
jgi:hypothetical protein